MAQIKGYSSPTRGPVTADVLGFNGTTALIEREVGSEIFYLDPDVSPYTLLSDAMSSEVTDAPRYEWYEKSLRPKTTTLNAGGSNVDGSATTTNNTLVVNDADVLQVGDLVLDLNTSEVFLVSVRTNSTSYTVIRAAAGSTASATNADADSLTVIGSAFSEGVDVPPTDEWQEVQKYNFVQIFRRSFGGAASRESTQTYFGRGFRDKLAREKSKEFAMDVERAFIAGGRSEGQGADGTLGVGTAGVGTGVIRTTGGFLSFATSNVLDLAGAALSEPNLEGHLEDVFEHTAAGDTRSLFAGTSLVTALDMIAVDKIRTVNDPRMTYGIAVKEYVTSHGRLLIIKSRILSDLGTAYARGGLIVDTKRLGTRTLSGRATKLMKNRQSPGVDGWIDEYIAEMGHMLKNPEVHGVIKNAALAA